MKRLRKGRSRVAPVKILPKVKSLGELRYLTADSPRYARLAMIAASNMGGPAEVNESLREALGYLETALLEAVFASEENGHFCTEADLEQSIVDEVNFVRDLEAEEYLDFCRREARRR